MLALHRTRQHWVSVRTATVNALRGLLYEFGVVLRGGRQAGLKALAEQRASIDEQIPATMRALVDGQLNTLEQIGQRIDQLEREIAALQEQLKGARELRPGARHRRAGLDGAGRHAGRCARPGARGGSSPPAWGWCRRTRAPAARCASGTCPSAATRTCARCSSTARAR